MTNNLNSRIANELQQLNESGQLKHLRHLTSPMGPLVHIEGHGEVVMLCSNDYLGLANHPEVVQAGIDGLNKYGAGTASVRFITGTFDVHRELESTLAELSGTQASLTYSSAWAANEALFPTLVAAGDVIISDALNHASLIDSIRQTKDTTRVVFPHSDLEQLEQALKGNQTSGVKWVVTDGVFSMEGDIADLAAISGLCKSYDAVLVVDDSHGVGVLGERGLGTAEHCGVFGDVDVITGTLGKALGGAAGGYISGRSQLVDLLIQRSRPGLFSNALPATVACSAKRAIEILQNSPERVQRLRDNSQSLRDGLVELGFEVHPSPSAITPIIVGETAEAIAKSKRLLELGVMVIGFGYPVVPKGAARLRLQSSAALEPEHITRVLDAFSKL